MAAASLQVDGSFGAGRYDLAAAEALPEQAVLASLGCGNPTAVADPHPGERVLDLGSGGGIDVLLSARRVGLSGFAHGVDMTEEMPDLARADAGHAGATNVEFLRGRIEAVPLPDAEDDVTREERAGRVPHIGCVAGALSRSEHLSELAVAGFTGASVQCTHEVAPNMHGAIVRATKPHQPSTGGPA